MIVCRNGGQKMIEQIIKLRGDGLSFRKIAVELNTTVGKVQYRWNKWMDDSNETKAIDPTTTGKASPNSQTTPEQIPHKGELKANLVSPRKIILFWEVSELPNKIIEHYFNKNLEDYAAVIRIFDVTNVIFNGKNAHHFYEIPASYQSGHWVVKGLIPNRSYVVELGVYFSETEFFPLLRSNCMQTPNLQVINGFEGNSEAIIKVQEYEEMPPKWTEHVSTYSYYVENTINLEEENE
jgi:uncharacterized protein